MSFLYPLGLLGLIAVPVLIIVYIIKNRYTEQVVPSTYLWELSRKFLRNKNPINRVSGILSLILQILAVVCISFSIAHPVFTLKGAADDYLFILDGSGSMNYSLEESTRFEKGKAEIAALINGSADGSAYTLVYAADSTSFVYTELQDKANALLRLNDLKAGYGATGFVDAHAEAQKIFTQKPATKIYLVTDKQYQTTENVNVIRVASEEKNYALSEVSYQTSSGKLRVNGKATSYSGEATVEVALYLNGEGTASAKLPVTLTAESPTADFSFESDRVDFTSARVALTQTDGMKLDDECVLFNEKSSDATNSILLVSDNAFYSENALRALGYTQIQIMTSKEYENSDVKGYGLYVFEDKSPKRLPNDGAVWFINPTADVENAGFHVQGEVTLPLSGKLQYSKSTSSRVRQLLRYTNGDSSFVSTGSITSVKKYVRCSFERSFSTIMSYEGSPALFVGTNSYGNRQAVFAFSFFHSDFPVQFDYLTLISNLLEYTFPQVLPETQYTCGDVALVNVLANCESVRVDTPTGDTDFLDTGSDIAEYTLTEVGTYTVTLQMNGFTRVMHLYSSLPAAERAVSVSEEAFSVSGTPSAERRDGRYDDLLYLFIILAVIFIADWMVYCYEQYQLR